jgi:hypothetical protein
MVKGAVNVDHTMRVRSGFNTAYMEDVHSLDDQRLANILCLAYGSPAGDAFKNPAGGLPAARLPNCQFEYDQALNINQELLKKVEQMPLLIPSDSKL